jgi:hypothetical protein
MISAGYINNQGAIFGHGVLLNGDQRVFLLIRYPGVPLPPAPAPARPLPAITGPPDRSISVVPCTARRPPRVHVNTQRQALTPAPRRRGRGPRHPVVAHGHLNRPWLHPKITTYSPAEI